MGMVQEGPALSGLEYQRPTFLFAEIRDAAKKKAAFSLGEDGHYFIRVGVTKFANQLCL